eukprot:Em0205g3a
MLRSNRIVARLAPLRTQFSFVRRIQALRTPEPTNANGSVFSVKAVEELLEANKCNYSVGHASYVVQCPLCDGGGDGKKDIYVNKTTGNVVCKPCRVKASWSEFSQWLKLKNTGALPVIPQKQNPVPSLTEPSWRTTKSWADSPRDVIDRVNSAFGIEFPTLSGTTAELPCVVFPWFEEREDKAPFRIKMETVVDRSDRQVVLEPKDGSYGLFGWNTVPAGAKEVDEDKRKYKVVRDRYEAYFVKKRNAIYERAKFNLRKQEDGEPVDDFVTSLNSLAQYCNFGEWCAGMVVVPKADGKIRICVDFTKLNESIEKEALGVTWASPSNEVYQEEKEFRAEIQAYVDLVVRNIPTSEPKMVEIKQAQQKDEICQKVIQYCQEVSPRYPQGNGEAERAVRTIKIILDKAKDPYLGLLAYRSTPSELLMNRRLRTTVPMLGYNLHPSVPNYAQLRAMEQKDKQKQKTDFDRCHASRSLQQLMPGDQVWIDDQNLRGSIVKERSILQRNRRQLKFIPGEKVHSHSAVVHNGGGVSSTDPVPHNVVILRDGEEKPREQQEAAVDPQEQERTLQVPEESVESHEQEEAIGQQELEGVVEPQVQGYESEGQYVAPNLNNPNASGSHKQQELVQPTPVITRSGRIVITRGEFDAIAVNQSTGIPAVALPGGTFLPPEVLPQLEPFERIVVWFGNDAQARQAASHMARKLNMERCFLVCSQDGLPKVHTPLDALKKGVDLRLVIDSAKPIKHKKIVTFNQLRDEVYGELSNSNQVAGVKWHRFPKLNQILKGHRPGELTVFTGPTGSGKTTFISELSLDLAMQGVTTLWGSFEIKNVRLAKTMMYQLSGMRLEKQLEQYGYWADRLEQLPLYFMGFYGPVDLQNVIETMSHSAYVHDIQHVIVDNLQFMTGATHNMSDKYSLQSQAIAAFRMFASEKNVHVTVVIHPRKEEESNALTTASIFGTAKVSQEADNIMILQAPDKNNKFLQVTKNRFDGDTGVVPLSFDRESLTLSGHFANKEVHSDREEDLFVPLFEEGRSSSQVFKASSVPISKYQIRTSLSRPTNTSAVTTQPLTPIIPSPTYTAPVTVATPSITIPTVATPPVTTSIVTTPPVTSLLPGHQSSLHHGFKLSFVKQPATASPVAKQPAPSVGGPVAKVPNGPIPLQGAPSTRHFFKKADPCAGGIFTAFWETTLSNSFKAT